jgi:hypothetical protein
MQSTSLPVVVVMINSAVGATKIAFISSYLLCVVVLQWV